MSYQEVLAPVITLEADQVALSAAAEIAQKFEARAIALVVAVDLASAFAEHTSPLSEILVDLAKGSHSHSAIERAKIIGWLETAPHDFNIRDVTVEDAVQSSELVAHARTADLTVIARSPAHNRARRAMLERVLFKSGRPVLLVPEVPCERQWERVMIGWNAKAEAMRAVTGALPLLKRAREVVVATVDAAPSKTGHGQAPGHDIAARLAADGVRVEVRNLDSMGRSDGAALLGEALNFAADMLVLGAYGHSRAQEFLFGGVTRELLAASPIPLFMAH